MELLLLKTFIVILECVSMLLEKLYRGFIIIFYFGDDKVFSVDTLSKQLNYPQNFLPITFPSFLFHSNHEI